MDYGVYLSTKIKAKTLKKGEGMKVLEPEDYTEAQVKAIKAKGYTLLAYLSIGTLEKDRSWWDKYKKYKLKQLEDWPKEYYMDLRRTNWRQFLISRAKELKNKGFDGWWLDNLDVYSEYKSIEMYAAAKALLKQIKNIGGYVMINGGSEWLDDAIDKKVNLTNYLSGYTQEEVFSLIRDYSGKGTFGKQEKEETTFYKGLLKKAIKKGIGGFLLEYTRDEKLSKTIKSWCKENKASYYISKDVNL